MFDDMKLAVEALSGGKNTVVFDDLGMPSIMVILPKMLSSDVITGATQTVHPAFMLDNAEQAKVAISKYQNIVVNSRAYSLPMQDPKASITFDSALAACRAKGEGWGLTPVALWGAIALWCKKNGTMPHGNNNYGADHKYPHERGVPTYYTDGKVGIVATGSGPATWYHDHTPAGIADLNGNVYEWQAGMRLATGEIQIIPYADCMKSTCSMGANSAEWKAIMPDGSLVAPGTDGTLKYDYVNSKVTLCTNITVQEDTYKSGSFQGMTTADGIVAPQILKELALFPADADGYESDYFYINNGAAERVAIRGGDWHNGAYAGVFYTNLNYARSYSYTNIGFRSAFYGKL